MTDSADTSSIRDAVTQRLARRYRAELRFRVAGLAAVASAVGVLVLLLVAW